MKPEICDPFSETGSADLSNRSGSVSSDDKLVALLYLLLRDHVHPGDMENLVKDLQNPNFQDMYYFANGWLATYAMDLAKRLK